MYYFFSAAHKKKDKKITYKLNFIDSYRFMSISSGVYDKEC